MEGGELDANDKLVCKRALLQHKASMSLAAAGAAVEQGVLILGNQHLQAADSANRKLEQLDTSSSSTSSGRSFELAARLLQYNRAYATRLTDESSSSTSSSDSSDYSAARLKQQALGIADKSLKFIQVHLSSTATTAAAAATAGAAVKRAELLAQRGWWLQYKATAVASSSDSSSTDDDAQRHKLLQDAYTALSEGAATAVVSTAAAATAAAGSATTAALNSTRGDCHLQLAKLCDALAAEHSESSGTSSARTIALTAGSSQQSPAALAALAIEHYLQAAGAGGGTTSSGTSGSSSSSSGAVDCIPRALHLLGKGGTAARAAFASAAATIPEWVFLRLAVTHTQLYER
jgi:trimeric autotransporter adhesin